MSDPQKLDVLVNRRDHEAQKDVIGILYVFWSVMNTLGIWINVLVWTSMAFWAFWIPTGIMLMSAIIYGKTKDLGRRLWDRIVVPQIWVFTLILLPFFIWVFPSVLGIYSPRWVFSITSAWVATSLFTVGVFNKQRSLALGALAFWVAAPVFLLFPRQSPWIFTVANVLGLLIPGLVSRRGQ